MCIASSIKGVPKSIGNLNCATFLNCQAFSAHIWQLSYWRLTFLVIDHYSFEQRLNIVKTLFEKNWENFTAHVRHWKFTCDARTIYIQNVSHVWCGFSSGGAIGPYIFENERGQTVNVNGTLLWKNVVRLSLARISWIESGKHFAKCHTMKQNIDLL